MTVLNALDPGDRIGHIDFEHDWNGAIGVAPGLEREPARHAIHLVTSQGRIVSGFEAFRTCARVLPTLWPLVPLLYAPLMGSIGPRVYDMIAGRRNRAGCRDGTCGIAAMPAVPLRDR
jgi:predicted DCC family thiol-disulfide oxidoreductase YuxK